MQGSDIHVTDDLTTIALIFYYLDDILGGHPDRSVAWKQFNHSEQILKKLSLGTKASKAKPPCEVQQWLGKVYDTNRQWLRLPQDKVNKYVADMQGAMKKKSITKRELLRHIGRTRHMGSIYRPLSAFARNLERWAYAKPIPLDYHIRISRPLKNDLDLCIWAIQRAATYGISFKQFLKPMDVPDICLYTDASLKIGAGGISDQGRWFQINWDQINFPNAHNRDIVWRELVAIYIFLDSLKDSLRGKTVHIFTDNESCKYMLISMRCTLARPDLQNLINEICKICILYAIVPWFEHIAGKDNVIADALSRNESHPCNNLELHPYKIDVSASLQYAVNICKNIQINKKFLCAEKQ